MSLSKGVEVNVVICPACREGIYSVSTHDYHYCGCGHTNVDGGFDYLRYGSSGQIGRVRVVTLKLKVTKEEMYEDWQNSNPHLPRSSRQYGYLSWDSIKTLYRARTKKDIRMVAPKSGSKAMGRSKSSLNK